MTPPRIALPLTLILIAGCEPPPSDERLARMAEQSVEAQAAQNAEMARLNREVAEGTNRLVEADAEARQELLAAQRDLQRQQEQVGVQRDALESERKTWTSQRRTESVYAPIISTFGMALLAVLPLTLCWKLLYGLGDAQDQPLSDLLIQEIVSPEPTLLPPPQRATPPALPYAPESPADGAAMSPEPPAQPD